AMFASAILHGSGLIHAQFPSWMISVITCGLGAAVGARFTNVGPSVLLNYLTAALGQFFVVSSISMIWALLIIETLAFNSANVIVAYTPGALDVMMILSLALHLDPIFIGAHHVVRVIVVGLGLPAWIAAVKRGAQRAAIPPPPDG
ncbi:MAG: AbrB family transcriptional regulator, partial [Pseudorhodoplanes sp.]